MNSKLIKMLIASCLVLMVILFAEWAFYEYSKDELISSLDGIEEQPYLENELPGIDLSVVPLEQYAEMIARPLFIKSRKPVIKDESIVVEALDLGEIDEWVLVGIYSNADQLIASFKGLTGDKKHINKEQGDDISGWLIKEIWADKVIVLQSGKEQSILLRAPKAKPKLNTKSKTKRKPKLKTKPRLKPKMVNRKKQKLNPEK